MPGSFDFEPGSIPLYGDSMLVQVYRYDPDLSDPDSRYTLVPNVRCESIQEKEGAEPSSAQFSYILDDSTPDPRSDATTNEDGWPTQFEALWPIGVVLSDYGVAMGERLVVLGTTGRTSDGGSGSATQQVLWHGFAKLPQTDLSPSAQHVSFAGVGVAARLWDEPTYKRLQRESRTTDVSGAVTVVALPARFNPDGKPNKTKDGQDWIASEEILPGSEDAFSIPVFIEPGLSRDPDPRSFWTLADAVKYLIAYGNAGQEFVENPDFDVLDSLLKNRRPKEDAAGEPLSDYFDPDDSSTYTEDTISIRDYDASNQPWPEAVSHLLGYAGFGMRFVCEDDGAGFPYDYLEIYRKDQSGPTDPKELTYPKSFERLDSAAVDIQSLRVSHDFHGVANRIVIETKPVRYEMSFILAPGFQPASGDGSTTARKAFSKSALDAANNATRYKYREFIFDEGGDGHWDFATNTWVTTVPDFRPFWEWDDDDVPTYTARYRPGSTTLATKGADGKPLKSQLAISTDYAGDAGPTLWDATGTWQPIDGFELLKDRLGIRITAEDPCSWHIGKSKAAGAPYSAGVVDAIAAMADPTDTVKRFYLRLTTTIESDYDLDVVAERRDASPLPYEVTRVTDAHDHFKKQIIVADSAFNVGSDDKLGRDDTAKAKAHAKQLRAAHEFPALAGSFTIPGVNLAFRIGDRISRINGRDVSLRTNAGSEQGEAPTYPFVVAITKTLGSRQSTTFQISDRRAEVQPLGGHH